MAIRKVFFEMCSLLDCPITVHCHPGYSSLLLPYHKQKVKCSIPGCDHNFCFWWFCSFVPKTSERCLRVWKQNKLFSSHQFISVNQWSWQCGSIVSLYHYSGMLIIISAHPESGMIYSTAVNSPTHRLSGSKGVNQTSLSCKACTRWHNTKD